MKALPYTAFTVFVVAALGYFVWTVFVAVRERNLRRTRLTAKWSHFSRPNSEGNWEIGVHRVTSDDRAMDEVVMFRLLGEVADSERLEAEGKAMVRAGQFNEATL